MLAVNSCVDDTEFLAWLIAVITLGILENLTGNVTGWPSSGKAGALITPHCLYTYKQAKNVVLILDTIIHVEGSKFSCCNCTAVNRNTCRCNKAKTFSCEAYREYKFAISACCASDNSPLLFCYQKPINWFAIANSLKWFSGYFRRPWAIAECCCSCC